MSFNHTTIVAAVSAFALMAGPLTAVAGQDTEAQEQRSYEEQTKAPSHKEQGMEHDEYKAQEQDHSADKSQWTDTMGDLRASTLIGTAVVNAEGETVGEIEDVILGQNENHLILSVGEFLGMGGREVAITLDQVEMHYGDDASDLEVSTAMTKEQIEMLPEYKADDSDNTDNTTY